MNISINPAVQQALEQGQLGTATQSAGKKGDFAEMLMDVMKEVNNSQNKASEIQTDFMTGRRPVEVHDVMIAMEKASTSMQLTLAVRNKLLEAYQELSRMQI
ncbi:MAG: flagellar hook-basal body complex protein FliE [Armatimonadetes bacterium]|nr:flagellar hook-basal body complex protein FliE [Armatimonadota bacterium]MBS1700694.1 flagellar hook-basal body complex protein FliE [Armatimonadota bacterium]MBS1728817.1 flagellar hook-basal body complex protein FliE [Armatimonadota bacterium]